MRHIFIVTGILVAAVVVGVWIVPARTAGQDARVEIEQPANWVAFDADVQILPVSRIEATNGRFFRGSDGSDRLETWDAKDPSVKVISIKNVARARAYVYSPRIGWNANPMVLPPNGWHPLRYHKAMPNLSLRRDQIEGFQLYQLIGVEGDVQFLAPALNFFPLVRQHVKDGERWSYSNIRIREQDPALFEPPAGAEVTERTNPIGIVVSKKGELSSLTTKSGPCCSTPSKPK